MKVYQYDGGLVEVPMVKAMVKAMVKVPMVEVPMIKIPMVEVPMIKIPMVERVVRAKRSPSKPRPEKRGP